MKMNIYSRFKIFTTVMTMLVRLIYTVYAGCLELAIKWGHFWGQDS